MVLLVKAPELVVITAADVLVVRILLCRLLEREGPRHHHEKDDPDGKQVYDLALERHPQVDLGGHVAHRTNESVALEAARARSIDGVGEAEIGQF